MADSDEPQFVNPEQERDLVLDWLLSHDPNAHALYRDSAHFRYAVDLLVRGTLPALVVGYARQAEEVERNTREHLRKMMLAPPDPVMTAALREAIEDGKVHAVSCGGGLMAHEQSIQAKGFCDFCGRTW